MKILALHVDYIKFKPLKKALKSIGELSEAEKKEQKISEALVILTAVEKEDKVDFSVKELVKNVKDIAGQVKAKNVVLYPYAHLSNNLSNPDTAVEILGKAEKELKKDFEVFKAPFGYYKEFEFKVKGHPLSELSREIREKGAENVVSTGKVMKSEEDYNPEQLLREISKSKLDSSKLKDNDHRIIGKQMDLFSFNEVAPGMVFWHNNGFVIRNELINFWREVHKKEDYEEIQTPQMMDSKLWKISGHWDKYKDNNFISAYEERPFLLKPMNCPGGMLVYRAKPRSYKELPLKLAEMGVVHRVELSGVLSGLFRVIQFTQDDAHLFCADEVQAKEEIKKVVSLINFFYNKFGLKFDHVELSTRPEKRIGTDEMWSLAEKLLESTLKELKVKYIIKKGEGAFYGPKIDFHVKDSLSRTWQVSTIQLDFSMPERFKLEYVDSDNKKKRPIMLHRVIYGSLERFIGILLEHTNGRLPTWLAPIQARVISFTDRNEAFAKKVVKQLGEAMPGLRVDADFRSIPVPMKVREAEVMRVPYIIVVGDREEKEGTVALRIKGNGKIKSMKVAEFVKELDKEIKNRE